MRLKPDPARFAAAALLLAACLALAAAKAPGRAAHSPDPQECVEPADTIAGNNKAAPTTELLRYDGTCYPAPKQ